MNVATANRTAAPTTAQLEFGTKLLAERADLYAAADKLEEALTFNALADGFAETQSTRTRAEVSATIDTLVAGNREVRAELRTARAAAPAIAAPVAPLTHGMYKVDGNIYKVQEARNGTGRLYAKQLVTRSNGDGTFSSEFVYAPGVIRTLTVADRMTLEDAAAFGALYGTCCACGRTLTDEGSIAAGIGPICASRF